MEEEEATNKVLCVDLKFKNE